MRIHDISRPLATTTAAWPGDAPLEVRWVCRRSDGHPVNLSTLTLSPHLGTHVDAPRHVHDEGDAVDALDLDAFMGPARVVRVQPDAEGCIHPNDLLAIDPSDPPRVLLATGTHPDPTRWPHRFAGLTAEAAAWLVEGGCRLVGIDTPGIDPPHAETLPAHHRLREGGVVWIEGLDLAGIMPGVYRLVALPLRLVGLDASPVRAVLIDE
jgi:arylformamidase